MTSCNLRKGRSGSVAAQANPTIEFGKRGREVRAPFPPYSLSSLVSPMRTWEQDNREEQ
jgi:hypothetical protein